jgi:alkylation response protein AidB-like acyl-CoA dehydrogenase
VRVESIPSSLGPWCDRARTWPLPGGGESVERWAHLGGVAYEDLVLGRLVEAHADAAAITAELGGRRVLAGQRWAVWAAGPAHSVTGACEQGVWTLSGTKAWCSGATMVTHALVDAATPAGQQLFALDVAQPGVEPCESTWVGSGMAGADTRQVVFDAAAAAPVGAPGAYLTRPGFWAGAIGVAACWHGGSARVAQVLFERARTSTDHHLLTHLGAVHTALQENHAVLVSAGAALDRHPGANHAVLALSVRSTIEHNAAEVMRRVGRALGPGPLALDAGHAQLVADLTVYIRQHHAEADLETLGRLVAQEKQPWPREKR